MFSAAKAMSNSTSLSTEEAASCVSSGTRVVQDFGGLFNNPAITIVSSFNNTNIDHPHQQQPQKIKKKRSLPGNPDPDAEVIALSPRTLLATNRFVCEICNKGFQRDQNLQLHRRGHNLPWKLKQRNGKDQVKKRAYVCPEPTCVHHHPSRALGDLTGIKKHYCRKHGEKKWKCEKCSKIYAVQSDWKAHSKTCGTREYRCDCGTLFSRKDSFITHRAFCDALAEESARLSASTANHNPNSLLTVQPLFPNFPSHHHHHHHHHLISSQPVQVIPSSLHNNNSHIALAPWDPPPPPPPQNPNSNNAIVIKPEAADHDRGRDRFRLPRSLILPPPPPVAQKQALVVVPQQSIKALAFHGHSSSSSSAATAAGVASAHLSATALLQKAATVGAQQAQAAGHSAGLDVPREFLATWQKSSDRLTRDFLGLTAAGHNHHQHHHHHRHGNVTTDRGGAGVNVNVNLKEVLGYAGGGAVEFSAMKQPQGFGFPEAEAWADC